MGGDQHRPALITQFAQQVDDTRLGFYIHTGEGFIQ